MKIKNFYGVKNQFLIDDGSSKILQSYASKVAEISGDNILLYNDWDYSRTTLKYVVKFINDYSINAVHSKKDILALIQANIVTLK